MGPLGQTELQWKERKENALPALPARSSRPSQGEGEIQSHAHPMGRVSSNRTPSHGEAGGRLPNTRLNATKENDLGVVHSFGPLANRFPKEAQFAFS